MRRAWLLLLAALLLSAQAWAQQRPLITELPEPIADGRSRMEVGVDFFQGAAFPLTGLSGDLTRLGVVGGRIGLGPRVDLEVLGVLGDFLSIKRHEAAPFANRLRLTGDSSKDIGDFLFATKVLLRQETDRWPILSLRMGTVLPNLSIKSGIGINTLRTFGTVLAGKHFGKTYLFSNLGMMIFDSPAEPAAQTDKLVYGLAFIHPVTPRVNLVGEIEGLHGNPHPGTEDQSHVRLGAQVRAGGMVWDIAGTAGLKQADANSGIIFGVTRDIQLFKAPGIPKNAVPLDPGFFLPR